MKSPFFSPLTLLILVAISAVCSAEVYRVVDEEGNVSYSDMAPEIDSSPIEMDALNVIETPERALQDDAGSAGPVNAPEVDNGSGDEEPAMRRMRQEYSDFRIIHPIENQTFRGESSPATVAWAAGQPLLDGMKVVFYVDGRARPPTRDEVIGTGWLDRGEHTVHAELLSSHNGRVARTDEVTFFIHKEYQWIDLPGIRIR